jgi:hypothetical protein
MRARALRLALVCSLLSGLGAHLAFLQVGAWGAMAWRAARGRSVTAALAEAFDGKHPCAVCLAIKKSAPSQRLSAAPSPRLDMIVRSAVTVPSPPPAPPKARAEVRGPSGFEPAPFSPPPRRLLA